MYFSGLHYNEPYIRTFRDVLIKESMVQVLVAHKFKEWECFAWLNLGVLAVAAVVADLPMFTNRSTPESHSSREIIVPN